MTTIERKINVDNGGSGGSIQLTGNALEGEVIIGKTFYSNSKIKKTGTMINNGAVAVTIQPGQSYTVPQGYHDGTGRVTANLVTPADFSGTGGVTTLYVNGLTKGAWYAFAVFNGRDSSISYSSGLTNQRSTGARTSIMNDDGSSTTKGYVLCCVGETTDTSVSFRSSHSSNIRLRWCMIGDFGAGSGS